MNLSRPQKIIHTFLAAAIIACAGGKSNASEIGDQLDAIISTGSFSYEPYANVTLSQVGRHAYSLPRMRFSVPTQQINLVQFTPPSVNASCSSVSINLGNFSFISLDEAISALRSIAAQSLTYGFGQAVQALCQPCWAGMRDLQKQLQRLNKFARNTCALSQLIVDEALGDEAIEGFEDKMCKTVWNTLGDDMFSCSESGGFFSDTLSDFNDALDSIGADEDSAYVAGNVMFEAFRRLGGDTVAAYDRLIPTASTRLFFGTAVTAPEVAMSFFGSKFIGNKTESDKAHAESIEPLVTDLMDLVNTDFNVCEGTKCLRTYQCAEEVNDVMCPDVAPLEASSRFDDAPDCDLLMEQRSLSAYIYCHVYDLIEKMNEGNLGDDALSSTQRLLLAEMSYAEQSAFYTGTKNDIEVLTSLGAEAFSKFLEYSLLHEYVKTVVDSTRLVLIEAKSIENMSVHLTAINAQIDMVEEKLKKIEKLKDESLKTLTDSVAWYEITKKYSSSTSRKIAELNQAGR